MTKSQLIVSFILIRCLLEMTTEPQGVEAHRTQSESSEHILLSTCTSQCGLASSIPQRLVCLHKAFFAAAFRMSYLSADLDRSMSNYSFVFVGLYPLLCRACLSEVQSLDHVW